MLFSPLFLHRFIFSSQTGFLFTLPIIGLTLALARDVIFVLFLAFLELSQQIISPFAVSTTTAAICLNGRDATGEILHMFTQEQPNVDVGVWVFRVQLQGRFVFGSRELILTQTTVGDSKVDVNRWIFTIQLNCSL